MVMLSDLFKYFQKNIQSAVTGTFIQKKKKSWENQEGMEGNLDIIYSLTQKDIVKQQQLYTSIYTTCTNIFSP